MNNNPLVSVIMPVYNVENYLRKAIDSVLEQSYDDLELILVNDCSPDGSGKICDEYKERDSRVKVIHKKKNGGLSRARNTGIKIASGEWIFFIDSDDWIEKDTIECASKKIDAETDIVVWGYVQDFEDEAGNKKDTIVSIPSEKTYIGLNEIGKSVLDLDAKACFNYAWNKLYRKEFVIQSGIEFDNTILMEDFVYNIKVFPMARKVSVLDRVFSHYRKTPRETLVSKYYDKFFELCKMKVDSEVEVLQKSGNYTEEYIEMAMSIHMKHIMSTCIKECSKTSKKSFKKQYDSVKRILSDIHTVDCLKKIKLRNWKLRIVQEVLKLRIHFIHFVMFKGLNFFMANMSSVWRSVKRTS